MNVIFDGSLTLFVEEEERKNKMCSCLIGSFRGGFSVVLSVDLCICASVHLVAETAHLFSNLDVK